MRTMSIGTKVRALLGFTALTVAALGLYGFGRALPRARAVAAQTEVLRRLYHAMSQHEGTLLRAAALADAAVRRGDRASLRRLRESLAGSDVLIGTLPLASAPASVRVTVARATDQAGRIGVLLEEIASQLELGQLAGARARLAQADSLEEAYFHSVAAVRAQGLEGLLAAQTRVTRLGREVAVVYVAWLAVTLIWAAGSLDLLRRRFFAPLRQLRGGLRRVEEGDLSVALAVDAADEMGELTAHFNHMTQVLSERATRYSQIAAAGELLAGAAHEVNNPLMAIAAAAETRRGDPAVNAATRADLDNIAAEAHRAGQLLRAVITFLRPSTGTATLEDLNELVRDTWGLLWPQLRADGVEGSLELVPELPPVRGDRSQLQQLLVNLVSNAHQAVMASPVPRRIGVRTWRQDDQLAVEVRDTGLGVAEAALGELFKPFFTTRAGDRAGLGLYASRNIARAHGGELAHVPGDGPGATFVLTLPAAERAAPAARLSGRGADHSLRGLRILVVDDEPAVRRPIARFLARRGATVQEAADGREALGIAAQQPLDLVLTDLRMPGMDGVTLYRGLLARSPELAGKVLFLSGDVAQLADLGTVEVPRERVLSKPIELAELERRIVGSQTA